MFKYIADIVSVMSDKKCSKLPILRQGLWVTLPGCCKYWLTLWWAAIIFQTLGLESSPYAYHCDKTGTQ